MVPETALLAQLARLERSHLVPTLHLHRPPPPLQGWSAQLLWESLDPLSYHSKDPRRLQVEDNDYRPSEVFLGVLELR